MHEGAITRGETDGAPWPILVVEDEYYIADDLRRAMEAQGVRVIGPAPSVEAAFEVIAREPDIAAAVLDVRLGDALVWPVADALAGRGVPLLFTSGYDAAVLPPAYRDAPLFRKPADIGALIAALLAQRSA